jgi:AraC-like DNA-binding protein
MIKLSADLKTLLKESQALLSSFGNRNVTLIIHPAEETAAEEAATVAALPVTPAVAAPAEIKAFAPKSANAYQDLVVRFHDNLIKNFKEPIPKANEAAVALGMPISRFKAIFAELYVKPYYQYFLEHRLQTAKAYLEQGNFKVKDISEMMGYSQTIKFVSIFKKHFGYTPGKLKTPKVKSRRSSAVKKTTQAK